jgi:hypothetical protein
VNLTSVLPLELNTIILGYGPYFPCFTLHRAHKKFCHSSRRTAKAVISGTDAYAWTPEPGRVGSQFREGVGFRDWREHSDSSSGAEHSDS